MRASTGELPLARELAGAVARRRVAGILQREGEDPAPGPLSAAQVTKALSFYKKQPEKYTFLIRLQIQEAVGVEPTGVFDESTVQAIGVWQRDNGGTPPEQVLPGTTPPPPLAVDGMAGPRTLPRMFAHGLNVKSEGKAFGEEAQKGVIDEWHALTAEKRAAKLVELINGHLKKAGVPPVIPTPKADRHRRGPVRLRDLADDDRPQGAGDREADRRAGARPRRHDLPRSSSRRAVVPHRAAARDADQEGQSEAQRRAGEGEDRQADADPADTVEAAVKDPLPEGSMQALIAQGWFDSVYGAGSEHREAVLKELDAAGDALKAARKNVKKSDNQATRAALEQAIARNRKANAAYKNLPEENDAWTTGPMTGARRHEAARPTMPPPPPPTSMPSSAASRAGLSAQLVGGAARRDGRVRAPDATPGRRARPQPRRGDHRARTRRRADVAAAAGGDVEDDGAPLGVRARPDVAGVEEVTVTRKWDSEEPNAADIRLSAGLSLADFEQRLGAASSVPSSGAGRHLVVFGEQAVPATIFAVLGDEDGVLSLTVRRDN